MPAKKKSSSKSSSSKSSWVGSSFSEEPIVPQSSGQRTLTLDVRGVTWHFLNLSLRVPASTTVFELTALIGKRHGGSVTDLVLYKDEVNARNLLSEPMKTLDAIFHVPSDASSAAAAVIFYDFAAFESDCPLLLRPPDLHGTEKAKGGEKAKGVADEKAKENKPKPASPPLGQAATPPSAPSPTVK